MRTVPTYPGLCDRDAAVLAARAISPAVAAARGYVTVDGDACRAGGFAGPQAVPGLLIPRRNAQGLRDDHDQLRPHDPRLDDNGRPRKYELPAGARQVLDVTPHSLPVLRDVAVPILITESILKGDALQSAIEAGTFCVVDVNGTYGWRSAGAPLTDFWDIPLCEKRGDRIVRRREVTILFDSDTATNRKVATARHLLTEFLERRGARVRHVDVPPGPGGAKQGIDDALANGHDLARLLATAHPPRRPASDAGPDDPDRARIAALEAEGRRKDAVIAAQDARHQADLELLGDDRRPAEERIVAVKLVNELERVARHGDGLLVHAGAPAVAVDATGGMLLTVKTFAVACGCTPKHTGAVLKKLEREGSIRRAVTRAPTGRMVVDADGVITPGYVSMVRIAPTGTLESLRGDILTGAPVPPPRKRPAPKDRCPAHPDADLIQRTTKECAVCHQQIGDELVSRHPVPPPAPPNPPDRPPRARTIAMRFLTEYPAPASLNGTEVLSENGAGEKVTTPTLTLDTPGVISDPDPARDAGADADQAADRDERHRANDERGRHPAAVATARTGNPLGGPAGRGKTPMPKPAASDAPDPPGFRGRGRLLDSLRAAPPGGDD